MEIIEVFKSILDDRIKPSPDKITLVHNSFTIFFTAIFLGFLGVHRHLVGRYKTGLIIILTFVIFAPIAIIWIIYDVYLIAAGEFTDIYGNKLKPLVGNGVKLSEAVKAGKAAMDRELKSELKRTCKNCGNVWFSSKTRENKIAISSAAVGLDATCSCCSRGYKRQKSDDLKGSLEKLHACSKCGSKQYDEETVYYD